MFDSNEERHYLFVETAPLQNVRVSFGNNQVIQKRITIDINYYPFMGFSFLDMVPSTVETNNNVYNQISLLDAPKIVVSIAKRSGGFAFVDYPLEAFMALVQIHKDLELEIDIDFTNSYYRWLDTAIVTVLPFVIPIHFTLK